MTDVLILGSGGTANEVAEILATPEYSTYNLLGCLDDDPLKQGLKIGGLTVLGKLQDAHEYPGAELILALGSPRSFTRRNQVLQELGLENRKFLTVIHPTAWISPSADIGNGCLIFAFCQVGYQAVLEDHVILLSHCSINHDSTLGRGTICASSVTVSGQVKIGRGCYLGAGTTFRDGVSLGSNSITGVGTVVVSDLPDSGCFVGSPARPLVRS